MPKLLFVINNIEFLYSHRMPIILGALAAGYEVHVATCFKDIELKHSDKINYHYIHFNRNSINPLTELKPIVQLLKLYRTLKPAVIHHMCKKSVLYGCLLTRFFSEINVVNTIPGLGYMFISQSKKSILTRSVFLYGNRVGFHRKNLVVAFQNQDDEALFLKHKLVKPSQCILIRGSGVDIDEYKPTPKSEEAPPVIVLPARLLWDKGVGEFVEAARQLNSKCDARFVLIGDVDPINPASIPAGTLSQWVDEGVIEHWGWCDDMVNVFEQAGIVCLPSYREGMPKALLEAAAAGLPIVTTDTAGCRDVIIDGESGFIVPVRDFKLLAERLLQLISSSQLRQQMGQKARIRAEQCFSTKIIVQQHLDLYSKLDHHI